MNEPTVTRSSSSRRSATLNVVGAIILLLGIAGAGIVYGIGQNRAAVQNAAADGTWQDGSLTPYDSKSFSHDVQMYNGTMGVLVMKWWDLCDELKRPGSMVVMIVIGSVVAASGCFLAARRNNEA